MSRENFTPKIRDKIAASAGYQCSFPGCNRRTVGPGPGVDYISNSGYAAHIYAASKGGPRGQGGLEPAELRAPENGLWLCGAHAKLVDNNRGVSYPPETLLSYKALHEARVLLEHEGLYPPVGWLHEIRILRSPLFSSDQKFQLAKLNLIYGSNCTGKTAITEWIRGFFDCHDLDRWSPANDVPLELHLSLLNPKLQNVQLTVDGKKVRYSIDGQRVAFIPIGFNIFKPKRFDYSIEDDAEMLGESLGAPINTIDSLIEEVNSFPHAKAKNLRFIHDSDDEGNLLDQRALQADVQGTHPGLTLRRLSGGEAECVLIELVTAAARLSGKYCPTLLILDEAVSQVSDGFFEFYSRHLLDPLNQFQTLMCIPTRQLNLDTVRWNGWQVIRTSGQQPNIRISQDMRMR